MQECCSPDRLPASCVHPGVHQQFWRFCQSPLEVISAVFVALSSSMLRDVCITCGVFYVPRVEASLSI